MTFNKTDTSDDALSTVQNSRTFHASRMAHTHCHCFVVHLQQICTDNYQVPWEVCFEFL